MTSILSQKTGSLRISLPPQVFVTPPVKSVQSVGSIPSTRKRPEQYKPPSQSRLSKLHPVEEKDEEEIEWPDLPPMGKIKNAIARQRVSEGVSYILPMHKTKSSVENVYQTDLRVLFQEPYLYDKPLEYDDFKVSKSVKHHFVPNKATAKLKPDNKEFKLDTSQYSLNADSEKVRKMYCQTAPSRGLTGNRNSNFEDMKQRSTLFLPIKAKIPPEAARLKAEADKILKSVQEEQEKRFDAANISAEPDVVKTPSRVRRKASNISSVNPLPNIGRKNSMLKNFRRPSIIAFMNVGDQDALSESGMNKKAASFGSYEALKMRRWPDPRDVPEEIMSPYLSEEKASDIWEWLHHDEPITELSQFLQICS